MASSGPPGARGGSFWAYGELLLVALRGGGERPPRRNLVQRATVVGASLGKTMPGGSAAVLAELPEAGKVRSVIDRRYDLSQVPDALRYLGEGYARGKIVITI